MNVGWMIKTAAAGLAGFAAVSAATCNPGTPPKVAVVDSRPRLYTALDTVRGLTVDEAGTVWAATAGGVVAWTNGTGRIWTTADGLPANDVDEIRMADGVRAETSAGRCLIDSAGTAKPDAGMSTAAASIDGEPVLATANVDGDRYESTAAGLYRVEVKRPVEVALPAKSTGSHIAALIASGNGMTAAIYGDGLWSMAHGRWLRLPGVPAECVDATALARSGGRLYVGTSSHGVWMRKDGRWSKLSTPGSVPSSDIEGVIQFDGDTWASTFDHGLLRLAAGAPNPNNGEPEEPLRPNNGEPEVSNVTKSDGLSTNSPRAMAVFGGRLLVRHASGALDAFDGQRWTRAFGHELPRPYVSALDASTKRLVVAGWGGWAGFDGKSWEYHYDEPELKGRVVTAIVDGGDTIWIGTQNAGLLAYREGRYERYQEAQGLGDDWVTTISAIGGRVLVGTYTGGLYEVDGGRVRGVLSVDKFAIRSVAVDADGHAYAATPKGVYAERSPGQWAPMASTLTGGQESQAVYASTEGMWVGSHTALAFQPWRSLSMAVASR